MKQIPFFILALLIFPTSSLYADEISQDEITRKDYAYEFMNEGWGGEAIRGYKNAKNISAFFHRVGKVEKESTRLIRNTNNPAVNDELHTYQYEGLKVSFYLIHMQPKDKIIVFDVVITTPNWPVKDSLGIGTPRQKIEAIFGKSTMANPTNKWTYGDGLSDITFTFDRNNRAKAIHWHSMIE